MSVMLVYIANSNSTYLCVVNQTKLKINGMSCNGVVAHDLDYEYTPPYNVCTRAHIYNLYSTAHTRYSNNSISMYLRIIVMYNVV